MAFDLSTLTSFLKNDIKVQTRSGSVLGIDVGSSAIKVVQLRDVKGTPTLETYGELQLGPYEGIEIGRATHLPIQKVVEALVDILRESGTTAKGAAFALSYNSSFTSTIHVPTIDQNQISSMLPIEARKYIPTSLSKVTLDWVPLGTNMEDKVTNVLISAIYNDALERYESIMKSTGISVITNEIEIFSTIRSIVSPQDDQVVIIDFGALSTRLYIVEKGVVKKTHSIPLSGTELTSALASSLGIGFEKAEEMKRSLGIRGSEDDPRIQKTLVGLLERGLRELHTVVKRYEEVEQVHMQKVIMSGGGALLTDMVPYAHDLFSVPVVSAEPFAKVAYPAFLEDTLKNAGPSFAVAVGIALRALQPAN